MATAKVKSPRRLYLIGSVSPPASALYSLTASDVETIRSAFGFLVNDLTPQSAAGCSTGFAKRLTMAKLRSVLRRLNPPQHERKSP